MGVPGFGKHGQKFEKYNHIFFVSNNSYFHQITDNHMPWNLQDENAMLLRQRAITWTKVTILEWCQKEHPGVLNHRRLSCLFSRSFRPATKKTSKPALLTLCEANLPVTGGFPSQRASNAETVFIWWRHHDICGDNIGILDKQHQMNIFNTIWATLLEHIFKEPKC